MSKTGEAVHRTEDEAHQAELQRMLDEALGMTFPASDPVAIGVERPRRDEAARSEQTVPAPERRRPRA